MSNNLSSMHTDERIDSFLMQNDGKPVVVVQGLGFVGAVMSLVCANAINGDYAVIGIDLPTPAMLKRIEAINSGKFPIIASDPKIHSFYHNAIAQKNFLATANPLAYSKADVIIVDINLDVKKSEDHKGSLDGFNVDLSPFKTAMETIGTYCKPDVLVLVETTVPPGTCEKLVYPTIVQKLKERGLSEKQFKLGHSYERVMPGPDYIDSIQNFFRVFAGINEASADAVEAFLKTIISTEKYPLTRLKHTTATEMAKVLENSYRATNIAFMVEWSRFAEAAGVDMYEVVRAIRMRPTHANLMLPGIGVGGYCLTKDPLLASWSFDHHFGEKKALAQSEQGVRINDQMPLYAYQYLEKCAGSVQGKRMLLLGVSYRSNVGDTRFTPVEKFYTYCQRNGATLTLHDPFIIYWEELGIEIEQDLHKILSKHNYDIIVITTAHGEYGYDNCISMLLEKKPLLVYDTVGLLNDKQINKLKKIHTVKVLGRGDL